MQGHTARTCFQKHPELRALANAMGEGPRARIYGKSVSEDQWTMRVDNDLSWLELPGREGRQVKKMREWKYRQKHRQDDAKRGRAAVERGNVDGFDSSKRVSTSLSRRRWMGRLFARWRFEMVAGRLSRDRRVETINGTALGRLVGVLWEGGPPGVRPEGALWGAPLF